MFARFAIPLALVAALLPLRAEQPSPSKIFTPAVQPLVEANSLAGAVMLVADRDKTLALETVGYADVGNKKPMRPDSVFWIASMTKPVTGVALMMLVDEGKVKLDDPVEKYLPEFKNLWVAVESDKDHMLLKRPTKVMTVRQLMNHTSGLPFKSALEEPTLDLSALRDCVRSYAMTPLHAEPGAKLVYSNCGINTAGRIIEVVSGMPYEEFMEKRLFAPLGMKDTTFFPSDEQLSRLAKTYKPTADKRNLEETQTQYLKYPLNHKPRYPMPGGGLFSTANDVGRLCQMVLNGGTFNGRKYLSPEAVREMTTRGPNDMSLGSFAVGWQAGPGTAGHGGALATDMLVDTKRNLVTVYLVQHTGFAGDGAKGKALFRKAAEEKFGAGEK